MCGIIAMISKDKFGFEYKTKAIFQQMLYANALRGQDSTGVFGINKHGNLKSVKSAQPASAFLNTKTAQEFLDKAYTDYRVMVGHNRASTKGATIDENAHPFIEGNTCLVHNGTLHRHKHLKDVDVDSHAICHAMNEQDYKEVLSELDGAFALIWYDAKSKILRIARNKERPLYIIETAKTDFIASEPEMICWILGRNGITYKDYKYFDTKLIYSYDINNLEAGLDTEDMPEKKSYPLVQSLPVRVGKLLHVTVKVKQNSTSGTVSAQNYSQFYKHGQTVVFSHDTNTQINGSVIFRGISKDGHNTPCVCTVPEKDVTPDMLNANVFFGTYNGVSIKGNAVSLFIKADSLEPEKEFVSINGVIVPESDFYNQDLCHSCGKHVDPEEELFWVRYKKGNIKSLKCQKCCDADAHLKPLVEAALNEYC